MSHCIFCKIVAKEMKANIEFENNEVLVMHDINPQAPQHLLIIPKKHIEGIDQLTEADQAIAAKLLYTAKKIAQEKKWISYRLVFNNGTEAGQSVFHLHLHLLSGRRMSWPPG